MVKTTGLDINKLKPDLLIYNAIQLLAKHGVKFTLFVWVKLPLISKMVSPSQERSGLLSAQGNIQKRSQLCHNQKYMPSVLTRHTGEVLLNGSTPGSSCWEIVESEGKMGEGKEKPEQKDRPLKTKLTLANSKISLFFYCHQLLVQRDDKLFFYFTYRLRRSYKHWSAVLQPVLIHRCTATLTCLRNLT